MEEKKNSDSQLIQIVGIQEVSNGAYYISPISNSNLFASFNAKKENQNSFLKAQNSEYDQIFWINIDKKDCCYSILDCNTYKSFSPNKDCDIKAPIGRYSFYNLDYQKWIIYSSETKSDEHYLQLKSNLLDLERPNDNSNQLILGNPPQMFADFIKERMNHRYLDELLINEFKDDILGQCNNLSCLKITQPFSGQTKDIFRNCISIKIIDCYPVFLSLLPNPINVEVVYMPEKVKNISKNSFENFVNLKAFLLPSSLTNVDYNVFRNIYGLRFYIGDPKHLIKMHRYMLKKVTIPNYVRIIPKEAFTGCKSLEIVNVQENAKLNTIESRAFVIRNG